MIDLTTTYLGISLRSPLVPSASPLSEEIGNIKRMEDTGAGAVVLYSLFEEQLRLERYELHHHLTSHTESFPEALNFFPDSETFQLDPEGYLNHIRKAKEAVHIPVIASLNGTTVGTWTEFAKKVEQAGANAIELNIYNIPTDMNRSSQDIEKTHLDILKSVKSSVRIPIALKLSPYFSNMANMAKQFDEAGANALVLFNRFYQPDIDLENLEIRTDVILSGPQALRLPLRWIAILFGRIQADLAATSGIHRAEDVIKMLMVGANVTMLCSVLLGRGISYLKTLEQNIKTWMEEHEYKSVSQMRGSMSQMNCDNPAAFERAQYIRALQSFTPPKQKEK